MKKVFLAALALVATTSAVLAFQSAIYAPVPAYPGPYGTIQSAGPSVSAAGTGYVPGDGVTLTGGLGTANATVRVLKTQVVSATIAAGGTGGTNGACTVTGTTGATQINDVKFQAAVTISGNAITAIGSISRAGQYGVNPTDITQEPVTGCSLSNAKLNVTMGALQFQTQTTGSYTVPPDSPVAQGSTTGAGTGATFPITFGAIASTVLFPPLDENHIGGADNFSLGNGALGSLTTGYFNLAMGVNTLAADTTGPESLAIGWNALQNYTGTDGSGSIAIGTAAGRALTSGVRNLIIGTDALNGPTTANDNIAIGIGACAASGGDVGDANVCIGPSAMKSGVATRASNVAIGYHALIGKSDNTSNPIRMTVIGKGVLSAASLGAPARDVVVGDITGGATFASTDSVLIGSTAGNAVTSGSSLVFIGSNVGAACTTCASIVAIGKNVGQTTLGAGSSNIVLIGTSSNQDSNTSNTIHVGAGSSDIWSATGTGTASTSVTTLAGVLIVAGITTDSTHTDATVCEDTTTHQFFFGSGAAGICLGTSSLRFKDNVAPLNRGLVDLMKLDTISYNYKPGIGLDTSRRLYGFAAEQMNTVMPELVGMNAVGQPNTVDWAGIVPVLVHALQEQQREIEDLRAHR